MIKLSVSPRGPCFPALRPEDPEGAVRLYRDQTVLLEKVGPGYPTDTGEFLFVDKMFFIKDDDYSEKP